MKINQVSKGKKVAIVNDATLVYSTHSNAPVLLAKGTGVKPVEDHANGIIVEVLDGEFATCKLVVPNTVEVSH